MSSFFRKKKSAAEQELMEREVVLDSLKDELTILSRMLTGSPIDVVASEREGAWKGRRFLLPQKVAFLSSKEENERFYWFRIFHLSTIYNFREQLNITGEASEILKDSVFNKKVLELLFDDYPKLEPVYNEILKDFENSFIQEEKEVDYSWIFGRLINQNIDLDKKKVTEPNNADSNALPKPKTEIEAKPVDEIESLMVDKKAQEDYTLMHHFEKVDTAEEFSGIWRDFDGDDELEEQAEALNELSMKQTVRVDDQTHSVYQAEFISNASIPESADLELTGKSYLYDEWDFKTSSYKRDFCKVFYEHAINQDQNYCQETLSENRTILRALRKQFAGFFNKMEEIKRLNQGEELDTDQLTDMVSDIYSGHSPDEKVYSSKRKRKKDISILFLLDLSLSSDGYAGGNRIIDVEKQVVLLMGEVLEEYNVEFQVDGFYSKTRNLNTYSTYKTFDQNWQKTKSYIGGIVPEGYTRIGPALRHAKVQLEERDARVKWVMLLSDGKPNDYDKYEGKYGLADVKQALREMEKSHISTYALAIEENAKYYLPLMFGKRNYNIVSSYQNMAFSMSAFLNEVMRK